MPPIPPRAGRPTFHIRAAQPADIPDILRLVIELATYEKEPDSVKATPALIHTNLFEKKHASALLAFSGSPEKPGEVLGLALYFFNYSTWTGRPGLYLEDLFVSPDARGYGLGKALFAELGGIAQKNNCARMDWAVLTWNQPSIDFYEKVLGARKLSDWVGMRLEEQQIEDLKRFAV